jgi:antitoxin HigA-1
MLLLFGAKMVASTSRSSNQNTDWRDFEREPTHPGVFVKEGVLEKYGMTQQELANAIGLSRLSINEIVNGRRNITESTALRLERLTGVSVEFWLDLQRRYNLWHAYRNEGQELERIKAVKRS